MSTQEAKLDTLSQVVSQLYQDVRRNKALVTALAEKLKQSQAAGADAEESEPRRKSVCFDALNEVKPFEQVTFEFGKLQKNLNRQIKLAPGAVLVIEGKPEERGKIHIDYSGPAIAMAPGASLVLRNMEVSAESSGECLFEISGEEDGVGISNVRFENVVFDTDRGILNAGLHAWCHVIEDGVRMVKDTRLVLTQYRGGNSLAKVIQTKVNK